MVKNLPTPGQSLHPIDVRFRLAAVSCIPQTSVTSEVTWCRGSHCFLECTSQPRPKAGPQCPCVCAGNGYCSPPSKAEQ